MVKRAHKLFNHFAAKTSNGVQIFKGSKGQKYVSDFTIRITAFIVFDEHFFKSYAFGYKKSIARIGFRIFL